MKKIKFLFLIPYIIGVSCKTNSKIGSQSKQTKTTFFSNSSSSNISSISNSSGKINSSNEVISKDTITTFIYDTLSRKDYKSTYIPNKDTVSFFSPFFQREICEPGNHNHAKYKVFVEKSERLIEATKNKLIEDLTRSTKYINACNLSSQDPLIEKLGNINELSKCKLLPIPIYSPTFNIVLYNNKETIETYFDLDTSLILYGVIKDNKMIGLIKHLPTGASKIQCYYPEDSLSYSVIKSLNRELVAIRRQPFKGVFENFGCIINNHLVFALCNQGNLVKQNMNTGEIVTNSFRVECKVVTAEQFYLRPDYAGKPYLLSLIENAYKIIEVRSKTNK